MRARREPSMILGLSRSAGVIDWMIAWIRSISRSSKFSSWSRNWPIPGSIPMIFDIEPILRTCCICCRKSSRVKSPPLPVSFSAALAACSSSKVFSACSIRVSMSPMPRMREAIRSGWKRSKSVIFSPVEANMIGSPGDRRDRQRRATAGVAVELGEHDAVEADAVEERLRGVDRVLADHRVDDEEHLVGVDGVADVGGLLHQLGVDAEPAGGVDDDHVVQRAPGLLDRRPGHRDRVAHAVAGLGGEHRDAGPLADDLELVDRVGPLQVGGDQQRAWPWSLSHRASLAASVVLPAPWRPASMITVGPVFANRSRRVSPPRIATSSSLTILTICCAGFSAWLTSSPRARSLTAPTKSLTTGSATSASSSAIRISRAVASMSASDSRPCRAGS